ncbi:MAG: hypothetical protein DRP74_07850 [Candidatus Omnitrophota bacterium]|nr:MAG: hypothetical protein DRP74_07850 [Candidatus Omnitrophota bacterium]
MTKVTVVIRTTGEESKLKLLRVTVTSLAKQEFKDFNLIVVTYKNKEFIEKLLRERLPQHRYKVIVSPIRNRCFQSNLGIKLADSEYVAIIDDDMVLDSNWLGTMINIITYSSPKVACICSPVYPLSKIKGLSSHDTYAVLPLYQQFLEFFKRILKTLSITSTFWPKNTKILSKKVKEIPTIPSNCMVCRRKALIDVGFYDTSLQEPLRGDDYDLGFRLRKSGYKILSYDSIKAFHIENYLVKWLGKDSRFFMNMTLTEFYVIIKHREFIGSYLILLQMLYRLIESFYWVYKNKKPTLVFSVLKGIVKGVAQGFRAKQ